MSVVASQPTWCMPWN